MTVAAAYTSFEHVVIRYLAAKADTNAVPVRFS